MEAAPSCNNPRSLTAPMKSVVDFKDSLGEFPENEQKAKIGNQSIEVRPAKLKIALKHFPKSCELVKRGEERISLAEAANTLAFRPTLFGKCSKTSRH
jgi:hypothetical protein